MSDGLCISNSMPIDISWPQMVDDLLEDMHLQHAEWRKLVDLAFQGH
jgi:hypothetical protein